MQPTLWKGGSEELTDEQTFVVQILTCVSATLSLLGCLFIIISYIALKQVSAMHLRLILNLAIVDAFGSAFLMLSVIFRFLEIEGNGFEDVCTEVGFLMQFFLLASVLWTGCIAHTLLRTLRHNDPDVERYEWRYHFICWTVSLASCFTLLFTESYGEDDIWCWVGDERPKQLMRFLCMYMPLILVWSFNIVSFIRILRRLEDDHTNDPDSEDDLLGRNVETGSRSNIRKSMKFFMAILVICWIFPIVDSTAKIFFPQFQFFPLFILMAFFLPLQGFLNALAYGMNDQLVKRLSESGTCWYKTKAKYKAMCGCCQRVVCCKSPDRISRQGSLYDNIIRFAYREDSDAFSPRDTTINDMTFRIDSELSDIDSSATEDQDQDQDLSVRYSSFSDYESGKDDST